MFENLGIFMVIYYHPFWQKIQSIVVNVSFSDWLPVIPKVPQGSVLGLLLFFLHIDELKNTIDHSAIKLLQMT